jgi:hypothetical protein
MKLILLLFSSTRKLRGIGASEIQKRLINAAFISYVLICYKVTWEVAILAPIAVLTISDKFIGYIKTEEGRSKLARLLHNPNARNNYYEDKYYRERKKWKN